MGEQGCVLIGRTRGEWRSVRSVLSEGAVAE